MVVSLEEVYAFKDAVTFSNVLNFVFTDAVHTFISDMCPFTLALNVFKDAVALLYDAVNDSIITNLESIDAVYVCKVVALLSNPAILIF